MTERKLTATGWTCAMLFSLLLWALVLFSMTGCSGKPEFPSSLIPTIQTVQRTAEDTFQRDPISAFAAKLIDADVSSIVEEWHAPTPCKTWQPWYDGRAIHVNAHSVCKAGKQFEAVFQRRFTTAPDSASLRPEPAWLLVSFQRPGVPVNLTAAGWTDCWLQLSTNTDTLAALTPKEGSILRPEHGRMVLQWTPDASLVGLEIWMQQVWLERDANPAGVLISPMLHIRVGS